MRTYYRIAPILLCFALSCGKALAEDQPSPIFSLEQVKREFSPHQSKQTGTLFFDFKAQECGVGSMVSEHPQETTYPPDKNGLEKTVSDWLEGIRNALPDKKIHGEIVKSSVVKLTGSKMSSEMTLALALVHMSDEEGKLSNIEEWWGIGFLSDGKGSMTFASSSNDKDVAWRNANGIMSFTAQIPVQ